MSAILRFDFQKENNYVFWSKLSKLPPQKKKKKIHVTTMFFLKQGETRTNSVPISHPLNCTSVKEIIAINEVSCM